METMLQKFHPVKEWFLFHLQSLVLRKEVLGWRNSGTLPWRLEAFGKSWNGWQGASGLICAMCCPSQVLQTNTSISCSSSEEFAPTMQQGQNGLHSKALLIPETVGNSSSYQLNSVNIVYPPNRNHSCGGGWTGGKVEQCGLVHPVRRAGLGTFQRPGF